MTKNIPKGKYISNMEQVKKMHKDILKSNFSFEKSESLRPVIEAQKKIIEIILELMPQYYVKEDKEDYTDE